MTSSTPPRVLRAGLFLSRMRGKGPVAEVRLPLGTDLVLGGDEEATLRVPDWHGPPLRLISGNQELQLGPGMQVNMCAVDGTARLLGTYEELVERGETLPIPICMRRLNVSIGDDIAVLTEYVDGEADG